MSTNVYADYLAFLQRTSDTAVFERGITLREYFAGAALAGIMANSYLAQQDRDIDDNAMLAARVADEVLKALIKI